VRTASRSVGGILLLLAGLAIVLGSSLAWIDVPSGVMSFQGGRVESSISGFDLDLGLLGLVSGGVTIIASLAWLLLKRRSPASVLGLIGGLGSIALGAYVLATLDDRLIDGAIDQAASAELPAAKIEDLLSRVLASGQVDPVPGLGLYFVLVGGAVAVIVGVVGLAKQQGKMSPAGWDPEPLEQEIPGGSTPRH
jgi:hypothetical protein